MLIIGIRSWRECSGKLINLAFFVKCSIITLSYE